MYFGNYPAVNVGQCVYFWGDCVLIFCSASTLREQFNDEKAALQQSMGKNSALIAEKEQLVQTLRSEVGLKHTMTQSLTQRSQKQTL